MLNFRKLKHDFSPALLKEGKALHDKQAVTGAKIISLSPQQVRIHGQVGGSFDHIYGCEVEINLNDSTIIDSECECPHHFDCHHLASLLFYLEGHYDKLVVSYSKENDVEGSTTIDEEEKETLLETIKEATNKEEMRRDQRFQKETVQEYVKAAQVLGQSPFFLPEENLEHDDVELTLILGMPQEVTLPGSSVEVQLALKLPYRSKLLLVPHLGMFLEAVHYNEPLYIGTRRYFFTMSSFEGSSGILLRYLLDFAQPQDGKGDKSPRVATMGVEAFGCLLAALHHASSKVPLPALHTVDEGEMQILPIHSIYQNGQEEPMRFARRAARLEFALEHMSTPSPGLLIQPTVHLDEGQPLHTEDLHYFACAEPGLISQNTYYRFEPAIKRKHLRNLAVMRDLLIPQPLFGSFVENALAELMRYGVVRNQEVIEKFVTMPFTSKLKAECQIDYLNGELEASLLFLYDDFKVPSAAQQITYEHMMKFVGQQGILARSLTEEQEILADLFQGFTYHPTRGVYAARSEKKIIEFMTEVIPRNQERVTFHCPENLLDQFIYDQTTFTLALKESERVDAYEVTLKVDGHLHGISLDKLWECLSSKRAYIELEKKVGTTTRRHSDDGKTQKILVLDLERLAPVVQLFDEIGLRLLTNHKELRPLWSLASLDSTQWQDLPIKFTMSKRLQQIQEQMLGLRPMAASDIPAAIEGELRPYQVEGVEWLERLRTMHLNGILADDMGLGKTLQAITAITQQKLKDPTTVTLIVAPTSLLYNWKEEFHKFNPNLKILVIDGTPQQRRKLIGEIGDYDVIVTSYSLLQKDTDYYKEIPFTYAILDEAQHIKNRGTRNAKSVKMVQAAHRLILTGTPIENSLDELWSLFDFLMPGLLSSYDRFVEKYVRGPRLGDTQVLEALKKKVSPFIMRRMKKDVLKELPPITDIVYHCHLSETQRELYRSYAASAREELSQLVKKEGFERVQIHVLATLTRLKQICCHPAIFAKEQADPGDSAKYDMLLELLQTLIEGGHKTVIFSQYTRMLNIMREDFQKRGITFEYLDGSSKNRLEIVKRFNENASTSVFLVSLKAGGVGLNFKTANTVIHFDMWWNPAVEDQATARAHRLGQEQNVTVIKLITLNTIEEKILSLQQRKQGLTKQIISCEEELITKLLTWQEVLELLQT